MANSFGGGRCPICGRGKELAMPKTIIEGVFEVHHIIPVSEIGDNPVPNDMNVITLCPTCHRAVHYFKKMRGWDSLEAIMANLESIFTKKQIERLLQLACVRTSDSLYEFRNWLRENKVGDDE